VDSLAAPLLAAVAERLERMNYQEARQLSDKSGWHMTIRNDDNVWTHQCCREPGPPATEEDEEKYGYTPGEPTIGKPHAPHKTREEAEQCYHDWRFQRITDSIEFSDDVFSSWQGCTAYLTSDGSSLDRCDKPTKGGARYRDDHHPDTMALCPDHREPIKVTEQITHVTSSIYS
jgi:hypothetical protein